MSKIRGLSELQEALDGALSWRIKEIAYILANVKKASSSAQLTYLRAGVPLLYAHWEGFIKRASEAYLEYVANQNLTFDQLANCFVVFGVKRHLNNLVESRKSAATIEAVKFLRSSGATVANISLSNAVNTDSNLTSTTFANIATSLGVDIEKYAAYSNLIDESLVNRRNKIAHGEYLDIDIKAFEGLVEEVLMLLNTYKNDVENLASTAAYRVAAD